MADFLPEDVIVRILERLPIKSLIRFTCVSKRWRFIILCDPEFGKSQFQIASHHHTLRRRLLISTSCVSEFNSLDLDAPPLPLPLGYNSSVRCPFTYPGVRHVGLLSSCNGLILATLYNQEEKLDNNNMYMWNPSTQFFKKLADPADRFSKLHCFGFGYLSATDDYKVIASFRGSLVDEVKSKEMHIFSSKANTWKRTEAPPPFDRCFIYKGILSNEALHWQEMLGIVAFDLAKEEFQRMPLPILDGQLGAFGDCLCAFDYANVVTAGSIDLWVMKKYGVADSWTKLFNLKVSDQPEDIICCFPVSVMETRTFLRIGTVPRDGEPEFFDLVRIGHTKQKPEMHLLSRNTDHLHMFEYEETLLCLASP